MTSRLATISLAAAQLAWGASWVEGTVYLREGDAIRPLPRAFVSVSSAGGELLGTTRTDDAGRYRFVNLPPDRLIVTASKPGFQTRLAAGRAGVRIVLDCSGQCAQSSADFELSRDAVITGVILDRLGEPIMRARVSVRRTETSSGSEGISQDTSDDRGRFRIAGLRPGTYTLIAQGRLPGGQPETVTRTVTIAEGEQLDGLSITLGGGGVFRLGGRLAGVPSGEGYRTWIEAYLRDGSNRRMQAAVAPDGSFEFDAVTAGRYLGRAFAVERGTLNRSEYLLGVIDVQADLQGLTLQPIEAARVSGRVEVAAGTIPPGATVQFTSVDGFGYRWFRCGEGKQEFDLSGLVPGSYRVHVRSGAFYVKGLKLGGDLETSNEVTLSPGPYQITVVVAADHGLVSGTVWNPETRRKVPNAQVALQGDRGTLVVQSDQAGRFVFGRVIPGEYRICAWANISPEEIEDDGSWQRGDCAFKHIPIAAASEIEIDLHAVP